MQIWRRRQTRPRAKRPLVALPVAVSAAFVLWSPAAPLAATGPTRSEYVDAVEPICKSETLSHKDSLMGIEGMLKRRELKRAAPGVARSAGALRATVKRIAAVPRPPADVARLTRWLGFAKTGNRLLGKLTDSLRRNNRSEAQILGRELLRETKRANAVVVGFDFDYCRVDPARFR